MPSVQHSAKMAVCDGRLSLPSVHRLAFDKDFIFLINSLPSVPTPTLGKEIFYFLFTSLPSVSVLALSKEIFYFFVITSLPSAPPSTPQIF
jgi:hypothetical protein